MKEGSTIQKVHFFNLDVLRFFAAFMVVVFHGHLCYSGWFGPPHFMASADDPKSLSLFGKYFERLILNMDMGVDLFFLISGFLITYLLVMEKESTGRIGIRNFYIRRALRIWPLYYLLLALGPFIVHISQEPEPNYWWTIFFANNFFTIHNASGQFPFVHYWSVCIEEHYYLFWPLLIAFLPNKWLPNLFIVIIAGSIIFRAVAFLYFEHWFLHISYNTLSKMDVLCIGSWVGFLHARSPIKIRLNRIIRFIVYSLFLFLLCTEDARLMNSLFEVCFKKYIFIGGFFFLFLNFMFNEDSVLAFRKKNFLHYLGKISYGIYMYHNLLFAFIVKRLMYGFGYSNFYLFIGIYFAMVLLLSVLSYELLERHFLKFKDRFAIIKTYR